MNSATTQWRVSIFHIPVNCTELYYLFELTQFSLIIAFCINMKVMGCAQHLCNDSEYTSLNC